MHLSEIFSYFYGYLDTNKNTIILDQWDNIKQSTSTQTYIRFMVFIDTNFWLYWDNLRILDNPQYMLVPLIIERVFWEFRF